MGIYLNPGNSGFRRILNSEYVDKTGLIHLVNETIDTVNNLICVSRPRRFGKSFAAQMLGAYYDCSCDSHALFCDKEIAGTKDYRKHMNQYHVISLDITGFISEAKRRRTPIADVPETIAAAVCKELKELDPDMEEGGRLMDALISCVEKTGRKFIFIIDEWDAPIREASTDSEIQSAYLNLLREWFKNSSFTPRAVAAAYMTGILPIKKDGLQSAISDFQEYSIIHPMRFAEYVGFTEDEVRRLCAAYGGDFSMMKQWYDGYVCGKVESVYNPNSVMKALRNREFCSYWTETSASKSLMEYISMDFDGMSKTVAELLGGIAVPVDTNGFANDLATFRDRDDVLTLLIHLGYLACDRENGTACIPNEEIRLEFAKTVRNVSRAETVRRVMESDRLILDTVQGNEAAVAAQLAKIHAEETSPLFYNNEQALRSVIKLAYFSYKDQYMKFEELASGEGYADLVYLPKKRSALPALVIELKWNQAAEGAIAQIRSRRYPDALAGYGGDILLVGVAYGKDRKHTCVIEKL